MKIAEAYGIPSRTVTERSDLDDAIRTMLSTDGPYLLEAAIMQGENVMPMTPPGGAVNVMMMNEMDC